MTNANTNTLTFSDEDVVCGRGKGFELFPGNTKFRLIIKENADMYSRQKTSRTAKSQLIKVIFGQLETHDMRFVKRCTKQGGWKVLGENEIRLKIGHALRDVETLRLKSDRRKLHRMTKKCEIKQGMQDDLEKAIYVAEESNDFESIHQVRKISILDFSRHEIPQLVQETQPCEDSGSTEDLEPLPLGAAGDPIENIKLAVCAAGRRPSYSLIHLFRTEIAAAVPGVFSLSSELSMPTQPSCGSEELAFDYDTTAADDNGFDFGVSLSNFFLEYMETE
mmetsp:Transcript_13924/g.23129  ORF Transcript_13924/g.23129 Transcript_13924/m.23129 type:complete len:278 (-) Transcript_13924:85-918(-)